MDFRLALFKGNFQEGSGECSDQLQHNLGFTLSSQVLTRSDANEVPPTLFGILTENKRVEVFLEGRTNSFEVFPFPSPQLLLLD